MAGKAAESGGKPSRSVLLLPRPPVGLPRPHRPAEKAAVPAGWPWVPAGWAAGPGAKVQAKSGDASRLPKSVGRRAEGEASTKPSPAGEREGRKWQRRWRQWPFKFKCSRPRPAFPARCRTVAPPALPLPAQSTHPVRQSRERLAAARGPAARADRETGHPQQRARPLPPPPATSATVRLLARGVGRVPGRLWDPPGF